MVIHHNVVAGGACLTVFMLLVLPVVVLCHHILRGLLGLTIRHNHCGGNCTLSFRTFCVNIAPHCKLLLIKETRFCHWQWA